MPVTTKYRLPTVHRDQPRRGAPVAFAVFNVLCGLTTFGDERYSVPAYAAAGRFMPLNDWGISFLTLGLLISLGLRSARIATITSAVAFGWWILWTTFVAETVGHNVSPRAVATSAGIAFLHLLLTPYRRDRALDAARCDRQ